MTFDTWAKRCNEECARRECSQECLGIGWCSPVMERVRENPAHKRKRKK